MAIPQLPNWQATLLRQLGVPTTPENVRFLNAWAQAEGGNAANNPFNTTEPGFGNVGSYNSVGVKEYPNATAGIGATVATLKNGDYAPILAALGRGNSAMADAQAEAQTPWGTGSLIERVLGGPVTGGVPTTMAPTPTGQPSGVPPGAPAQPSPDAQQARMAQMLAAAVGNANATVGLPNPTGIGNLLAKAAAGAGR